MTGQHICVAGYVLSDVFEQHLLHRSPVITGLDGRILFVGNNSAEDVWTQQPQSCKTCEMCAPPNECPTCPTPNNGCNVSNQGVVLYGHWMWNLVMVVAVASFKI